MFCLLSIAEVCARVVALALLMPGKVKLPETQKRYSLSNESRGNQAAVPELADKNWHHYSFFTNCFTWA